MDRDDNAPGQGLSSAHTDRRCYHSILFDAIKNRVGNCDLLGTEPLYVMYPSHRGALYTSK